MAALFRVRSTMDPQANQEKRRTQTSDNERSQKGLGNQGAGVIVRVISQQVPLMPRKVSDPMLQKYVRSYRASSKLKVLAQSRCRQKMDMGKCHI